MHKLTEIAVSAQKSPDKAVLDALNKGKTVSAAADILGVSRTAVMNWMDMFNIEKIYVLPETKIALEPDSK